MGLKGVYESLKGFAEMLTGCYDPLPPSPLVTYTARETPRPAPPPAPPPPRPAPVSPSQRPWADSVRQRMQALALARLRELGTLVSFPENPPAMPVVVWGTTKRGTPVKRRTPTKRVVERAWAEGYSFGFSRGLTDAMRKVDEILKDARG